MTPKPPDLPQGLDCNEAIAEFPIGIWESTEAPLTPEDLIGMSLIGLDGRFYQFEMHPHYSFMVKLVARDIGPPKTIDISLPDPGLPIATINIMVEEATAAPPVRDSDPGEEPPSYLLYADPQSFLNSLIPPNPPNSPEPTHGLTLQQAP